MAKKKKKEKHERKEYLNIIVGLLIFSINSFHFCFALCGALFFGIYANNYYILLMHQPVHHSVMSFYVFSNIFFPLKKYLFIYLAVQGLSYSMWDLVT